MRIALISPKSGKNGQNGIYSKNVDLYKRLYGIEALEDLLSCPNSPLLTIAAIIQDYFDDIVYIDEEIEQIDFKEEFDIVALSFMTQQASRAFEIASLYRGKTYLVAGGLHPTNSPEETAQYFDTVFIGEGELTWPQFIKDFISGRAKKFYKNQDVIDMNSVPIPRYDLLKMDRYKTIPIQISRGCPHNCEFCASTKVYGPKYRHKSISQVLEEIDTVIRMNPKVQIYFTDDNMLVNTKFAVELLKELATRNIRWISHTDISVAEHDEILDLLFKAGCRKILIGFESVEPKSLRGLEKWKYDKYIHYEEYVYKLQSHGIGVVGTFIVGLDGDDYSVFDKVIDFALSNNLYATMVSVPTPFPGSTLFDRLEEEGRILTHYWGNYTLRDVVIKPKHMTVEELESGFEHILATVYSKENQQKRMNYFKEIYRHMKQKVIVE